MTRFLHCSSILYRNLLQVCPKDLRRDFGADMVIVFADDLTESWRAEGLPGVIRVWRCAAGELLRIALSRAVSAPSFLVSVISCGLSAICFSAELTLAGAHASTGTNTLVLAESIRTFVVLPSVIAAFVSFIAARVCAHRTNLSLVAPVYSTASQTEQL